MPGFAAATNATVPEAFFHVTCIQHPTPRALVDFFVLVYLEAARAQQLAAMLDNGLIALALGAMCGQACLVVVLCADPILGHQVDEVFRPQPFAAFTTT